MTALTRRTVRVILDNAGPAELVSSSINASSSCSSNSTSTSSFSSAATAAEVDPWVAALFKDGRATVALGFVNVVVACAIVSGSPLIWYS